MSLFYARTNVLLRRFGKYNVSVKLCLFNNLCTPFNGIALWVQYHCAKETQCCIYKINFGYERRDSVTTMFLNLVYQHLTLFCTIQNLGLQL